MQSLIYSLSDCLKILTKFMVLYYKIIKLFEFLNIKWN